MAAQKNSKKINIPALLLVHVEHWAVLLVAVQGIQLFFNFDDRCVGLVVYWRHLCCCCCGTLLLLSRKGLEEALVVVVLVILPVDKASVAKTADISWRFAKLVGIIVVTPEILRRGKLLVAENAKFRMRLGQRITFHVECNSSCLQMNNNRLCADLIYSVKV